MPYRHAPEKKNCALILGGTRGLGLALVREAVASDLCPIAFGRSAPFHALMPGSWTCRGDITDPETWNMAREFVGRFRPNYLVWNAGIFDKRPIKDAEERFDAMIDTHLRGPVKFIREFHRLMLAWAPLADPPGGPYHLVTIASTSSYRMRDNETLYCALKAAKAHFTRNFAAELARDLPGSRTLLVNPGGMRTDFLKGVADVSNWMDPAVVAKIIWDRVAAQTKVYEEINILRQPDGSPQVVDGPQTPEMP